MRHGFGLLSAADAAPSRLPPSADNRLEPPF